MLLPENTTYVKGFKRIKQIISIFNLMGDVFELHSCLLDPTVAAYRIRKGIIGRLSTKLPCGYYDAAQGG
jgi:hypothetical protein